MTPTIHHLHADGVSVIVDARGADLPRVLHWGAPLGTPDEATLAAAASALSRQSAPGTLDAAWELTLLPAEGDGWAGRPGMQLQRDGVLVRPRWQVQSVAADPRRLVVHALDDAAGLRLTLTLEIASGGAVRLEHTVRNDGIEPIALDWIEPTLPVPPRVTHLTTLDGRWSREKRAVTTDAPVGSVVRQSRRGRPGDRKSVV